MTTNEKARARVAAYRQTDEWRAWYEGFREQRNALKRKYRLNVHKNDAHVKEWEVVCRKEVAALKRAQALVPSPKQKAREFFLRLGMKLCGVCGSLHSVRSFHKDASKADGMTWSCKACEHRRIAGGLRNCPIKRLKHNLGNRLRGALLGIGCVKGSKTREVIGCDFDALKSHLEKQFTKGMAWDLIGDRIHIDHIVPLASATTEAEVIALSHLTNLRPMWAADNASKAAKRLYLL